jgi:arylsulfatase A-like enzyme
MKTLVISVRGFHLGYLGCYANEWISTPALDRLAADGIVFDQHFADVPETAATRRAWRSGRYQLSALDREEAPPSGTPNLIEALRHHGVRTVLVADGSRPLPEDFVAGWDHADVVRALSEEATFLEQTLESARTALGQLAELDCWLLWVDLAALLPPWEVPAEFSDPYFQEQEENEDEEEPEEESVEDEEEDTEEEEDAEAREERSDEELPDEEFVDIEDSEAGDALPGLVEDVPEEEEEPLTPWFDPTPGLLDMQDDIDFCRLQSSYAAAVSFVDAAVDALLSELAALGLAEDCLVVLTSDQGQVLGEHGIIGPYRPWLHEELIHLPLLLRLPARLAGKGEGRNLRVAALTQTPDIMPTLLEAFGLAAPEGVQGRSLLALARGQAERLRDYACSGLRLGGASEWSLRAPGWAFLLPGASEPGDPPRGRQLYVKPDDRWEVNDVLQHHLDRADAFEQTLKEFVAAAQRPGPLEPPAPRKPESEERDSGAS